MLVSQVKKYVSVYIAPTLDLTVQLEPQEKGVVGLIGQLSFGNPHKPVIMGNATEKIKTTLPQYGGTQDNETAYHIEDYFSGFNGKLVVGRVLGTTSKTKKLKVSAVAGVATIEEDGDINIFGTNNIKDWEVTANTNPISIVINACISEKHSLQVSFNKKNDEITVKLFDRNGNVAYTVTGGSKVDSKDAYGKANYIGLLSDTNILTIKADSTNALFDANFDAVKDFENGLVTEAGAKNYDNALNVISAKIESCDYFITAGLTDTTTIKKAHALCFEAKTLMIVDVVGATLTQAKTYKNSLNMNKEYVTFLWNRGKDVFEVGNQDIGLSGWFAGQTVAKNLSKMVNDVESRVEGVAGVDYRIPREKADELTILTDDELTELVDERLNTVRYFNNKLVMGDILSAYPKWSHLRLFPIVEGKFFLDRYIARIIISQFFKNGREAKRFVKNQVRLLFEDARRANYFNIDVDPFISYTVELVDADMIVVKYQYVPEGVVRRGSIIGSITLKINV